MKIFEGKVVSIGMTNTVVVEIFRTTPHPLYKKLVRLSKKFKVDTNGFNEIGVGSVVKITETKPMSKGKYFKISEVVGAAPRDTRDASADAKKQSKKAEKEAKVVEKTEVKATAKVEKLQAKKTTKATKAKTTKKETK